VKLRIAWDYPALAALMSLHPHEAMAVDRAVLRFAEAREGHVERLPPYYRLHIGTFRVRFAVDRETGTMSVLYLYRVR
jgi:mRNA-degrading endonuclease RelE of RelBE toxin-antitoxin system